ncbi:MAG: tetratricopeptide repeat protein, partial [Chloroflexi bacterium]|nr:tetratricopeptide repeat protein [Chloroflexota bacterium]
MGSDTGGEMSAPKSIQDVLKRRRKAEIVGRGAEIEAFRRNLELDPANPERRYIFNVSGIGGVGKTYLLRVFRRLAEERGAVTGWVDERIEDTVDLMGNLADQFQEQQQGLKSFSERYRTYRQKRQEVESHQEYAERAASSLGQIVAEGSLELTKEIGQDIPGVAGVLRFAEKQGLTIKFGEIARHVTRNWTNKDETQLVLHPERILTPLFLADLCRVTSSRPVAIFIDTYERTSERLDMWLRDIFDGKYGDSPLNSVLAIGGQHPLEKRAWSSFESVLVRLPLDPFTEGEARDFLSRQGVTDEETVETILRLSGRLPLLVATLSVGKPSGPGEVGSASGTAVGHFLKWVDDPTKRRIALDCALPRQIERRTFTQVAGSEASDSLFDWLGSLPFIDKPANGRWTYHQVVRDLMLRHKRDLDREGWSEIHRDLATYYERRGDELGLSPETGWRDHVWLESVLDATYHRLCQNPGRHLPAALNLFTDALRQPGQLAQQVATVVEGAGNDAGDDELRVWGERLESGIKALGEDQYAEGIQLFTAVLNTDYLESPQRAIALDWRGFMYSWLDQGKDALRDFDLAVSLVPDEAEYLDDRGAAYRLLGRYEEALADFDRALELQPDSHRVLANRGETYRLLGRNEEALADLGRAIDLQPDSAWALDSRARVYRTLNRTEEALVDYSRAVMLEQSSAEYRAGRGETYQLLGRYEEALSDFDCALELEPGSALYRASRGAICGLLRRPEEALVEYDRALVWISQ